MPGDDYLSRDPHLGFSIFRLYISDAVHALDRRTLELIREVIYWTGDICSWTCIVLQSTSTLPEENLMNKFDTILGRSFIPNIVMKFAKQEFETSLCYFYGELHGLVLRYLPKKWSPIRIISYTEEGQFQILKQGYVSLQLGRITELCLNGVQINHDIDFERFARLECLSRLDLRKLPRIRIFRFHMGALEYINLVDLVYKMGATALRGLNCPRLREVVLERCFDVDFVFDKSLFSLQKLFIKDCPRLVDIHGGMAERDFPELKEVQVENCPLWRGPTCNPGGNQPSGRWTPLS
jgi:hypothetical protein